MDGWMDQFSSYALTFWRMGEITSYIKEPPSPSFTHSIIHCNGVGIISGKKYDIMIIGDLVQSDLLFAEQLSRNGFNCCVLRKKTKNQDPISLISLYHTHFNEKDVIEIESVWEFLRYVRESRLIVCFSGKLITFLGYLWIFRKFLRLPPIINITTGSDITELVREKSCAGIMYRQYLNMASLNWCALYPRAIENVVKYNIPHVIFMRYPYYLISCSENEPIRSIDKPITFFHVSHLDWKVTDSAENRNSSKGNDRFIRAFAKAIKNGLPAKCIILDRGPDREIAKQLIRDLHVEDCFIWKSSLSRDDLVKEYFRADVIVDQFDVGGFGGIAMEAMSAGKPVMIYIDLACARLLYPDIPPVLNCHSEDEIYAQIMKCNDHQFLEKMGNEAKEWVYKYHCWETCLDQFIFYYTLLTGHKVQNCGGELPSPREKICGGD